MCDGARMVVIALCSVENITYYNCMFYWTENRRVEISQNVFTCYMYHRMIYFVYFNQKQMTPRHVTYISQYQKYTWRTAYVGCLNMRNVSLHYYDVLKSQVAKHWFNMAQRGYWRFRADSFREFATMCKIESWLLKIWGIFKMFKCPQTNLFVKNNLGWISFFTEATMQRKVRDYFPKNKL